MLQKPNLDYIEFNTSSNYINDNGILPHRIPNREQNSDYIEYFVNIDNVVNIRDFNFEVHENKLAQLIVDYSLYSLYKGPTYF